MLLARNGSQIHISPHGQLNFVYWSRSCAGKWKCDNFFFSPQFNEVAPYLNLFSVFLLTVCSVDSERIKRVVTWALLTQLVDWFKVPSLLVHCSDLLYPCVRSYIRILSFSDWHVSSEEFVQAGSDPLCAAANMTLNIITAFHLWFHEWFIVWYNVISSGVKNK